MTQGRPRQVELDGVPAMGRLYARAVDASLRTAAQARLGRVAGAPAVRPVLPDVEFVVEGVTADPDRLTAYQHLLGETASDRLPAGFVHVLAFPVAMAVMVRPDFPLPPAGMVHLANRVEQRRPVGLGDRLEVRAHAASLRSHRTGTRVDLVTEVRAGDGDVAWRGVSTYLAKGVRLPTVAPADEAGAGGAADAGSGAPGGRRDPFVPPTPTGRWVLPADVGRRYAAVSGDHNPIHLSALTARPLGFRRAIAHGMYTAARALATVGRARGEAFTWTVDFAAPVLLPGTVAVRVAPRDDGPGWGYAGWGVRSRRPHLTGTVVPG